VRERTGLTHALQIVLPTYFVVLLGVAWTEALPAIGGFLSAGQRPQATAAAAIVLVGTVFTALLVYGSWKRWQWVFWLYIVGLGYAAISLLQDGLRRSTHNLFSNAVGALLFMVCLTALIRYGPWAMKLARGAQGIQEWPR
jgi:hypothetical protein